MKNINKETFCIHKESGHIGKIINEITGSTDFPDQWGIYWLPGKNSEQNKEHGRKYYWQDKDKIEILKKYKLIINLFILIL